MGSIRLEGVRFTVWSHDHEPPHVHVFYGSIRLVIMLPLEESGSVSLRRDSLQPANANRGDVRYVLRLAMEHRSALLSLWEVTHG